jgi:hypothetical protein
MHWPPPWDLISRKLCLSNNAFMTEEFQNTLTLLQQRLFASQVCLRSVGLHVTHAKRK